jgi:hypothetical protein
MSVDFSDAFYYDESSPTCLRHQMDKWCGDKYQVKNVSAGDIAGFVKKDNGYVSVKYNGRQVKGHTIVLALHGEFVEKGHCIDHIDGNRSNNRRENLRIIPRKLNSRNMKKMSSNTSGTTGVHWMYNKVSGKTYAVAGWKLPTGTRSTGGMRKYFSVEKLGLLPAFQAAVIYRQQMIQELIDVGAGYTERHGLQEKLK